MQAHTLKFVMVGDINVGKTQLCKRFTKNTFMHESSSTVGMEFATKEILFEKSLIKSQIWDTAGQERFDSMTKAYFRDTIGAFLVFDIHSMKSFESLENIWMNKLKAFGHENMMLILIANKVDGSDKERRAVSTETAVAFAAKHGMDYIEVSALTGDHVNSAFRRLILTAASILPDVKVHLDVIGLPVGWMKVPNHDPKTNTKHKYKYINYWRDTSSLEEPTAPAEHDLIYETEKKEAPIVLTCRTSSMSSTRSSSINRIDEPFKDQGLQQGKGISDTNIEIGFANERNVSIRKRMNCFCSIL